MPFARVYDLDAEKFKAGIERLRRIEVLSILVKEYEQEHYPVSKPSPLEAISNT